VSGPCGAAGHDLQDLEATSLHHLAEHADLQTRIDRKYVVPAPLLAIIVDLLGDDVRVLEVDGSRVFEYRSVYFDTPDLESHLGGARDRRQRFKVRTRTYGDGGTCMLEVKTRGGRGETVKHRLPYDEADRWTLTDDARAFVGEHVDRPDGGRGLGPVLETRYRRTTLLDGLSRVTIDRDLSWTCSDGDRRDLPDRIVVETKSAGRPTTTDRILWSVGHRPVAFSKYSVGLAVLDPSLPANKWNAALRRHLAWTPDRPARRDGPAPSDHHAIPGPERSAAALSKEALT
jgi:hypothetical protein